MQHKKNNSKAGAWITMKSSFMNQAVKNSLSQQRFEGLNPSKEIEQDLKSKVAGKVSSKQVVANIMRRIKD